MSHSCQLPSPICLPPAMGSMFLADAVGVSAAGNKRQGVCQALTTLRTPISDPLLLNTLAPEPCPRYANTSHYLAELPVPSHRRPRTWTRVDVHLPAATRPGGGYCSCRPSRISLLRLRTARYRSSPLTTPACWIPLHPSHPKTESRRESLAWLNLLGNAPYKALQDFFAYSMLNA